ncbi:MAG: hypothetical protein CMJ49_02955 [Planctomycetaceae bacterium]|nr:hypothetical protein [Planctomycetaceae bacterium]
MKRSLDLIDGYCHCGLRKYRPIEDVGRVSDRFGVSRTVLVQHLGEYDNSYIGAIVEAQPSRFAGVMLVDVDGDATDLKLPGFRGVRLVARTLRTHRHIWEQAASLGLNLVIYDEPTIADHVEALALFSQQHPRASLIISHLGMLTRSLRDHRQILDLAAHANVYVQVSGMHMISQEPYAPLVPIIERYVEAFGPRRLYYGSNFPVMGHDDLYGRELELMQSGALGVPSDMIEEVLCNTAAALWFV